VRRLQKEIEFNFGKFSGNWRAELDSVFHDLDKNHARYLNSYRRLVSLQAWSEYFLENLLGQNSLSFFHEAQNDALVSHVFARLGAWRSALQSLRSCIENTLLCLYYMDHPIELRLWQDGKYKTDFLTLCKYFSRHPSITSINSSLTGLDVLQKEYATLSLAVHSSAQSFRMTHGATTTQLWSANSATLGAWSTREEATLAGLNLLLLALFRGHLTGSRLQSLRKAISPAVPQRKRVKIKKDLRITLFTP